MTEYPPSKKLVRLLRAADEPPAPHSGDHMQRFTAWLVKEMPAGTVIGDPHWWARKLLAAACVTADELPEPPKGSDEFPADCERFRFLCADIHDRDLRNRRNLLLERMASMSASSVRADVDLLMSESDGPGEEDGAWSPGFDERSNKAKGQPVTKDESLCAICKHPIDQHRGTPAPNATLWCPVEDACPRCDGRVQQGVNGPVFVHTPPCGGVAHETSERECGCYDCSSIQRRMSTMIVCPECGNKRCPKSTSHMNACTNSNEPGQPGSRY